MNWDENLPDTSEWLPREDASDSLKGLFFTRCRQAEAKILQAVEHERECNIDNFDSGIAIEEIIRKELESLCPTRYTLKPAVIDDRTGKTGGEYDIVIYDNRWFPELKSGATTTSRRIHLPIESVYAVIEVKQSLDFTTLDRAMEKLVKCHRLMRPPRLSNQITENLRVEVRLAGDFPATVTYNPDNRILNPLFSAIVATGLGKGIRFEELMDRFTTISETLKRPDLVRSVCVLGEGMVGWGVQDGEKMGMELFNQSHNRPIQPIHVFGKNTGASFFHFISYLLNSIFHSSLLPGGIYTAYAGQKLQVDAHPLEAISTYPTAYNETKIVAAKDEPEKHTKAKRKPYKKRT